MPSLVLTSYLYGLIGQVLLESCILLQNVPSSISASFLSGFSQACHEIPLGFVHVLQGLKLKLAVQQARNATSGSGPTETYV